MIKTNDNITEENLQTYRDRLSAKTAAFVEECTALKPEASTFFKQMADNIVCSNYYFNNPEIIHYIKLNDLKDYLLEYYDHFYEANTKQNEYVFTLMKLGEKYKSEDDIPGEIKEDLERTKSVSEENLRKYSIEGLCKRVDEMFIKARCLCLADEIKQEGEALKEMADGLTDDIDEEINRLSGSLEDVVFELRKLLHEVDKGRERLERICP